jgi:Protein of unknown function (DUF3313)
MNRQLLVAVSMVLFSGLVLAVPANAPGASPDGLVSVQSRQLDEVYLRPAADWTGYRKVVIDPPLVTMKKNWLRDQNASRDISRRLTPDVVDDIVAKAKASMTEQVTASFVAKGYEITTTPGPGVMRVTPTVTDLDVYEPDVTSSRPDALFTRDTAGMATLGLEARDAVTGALLGVVVDRGTATHVQTMSRATKTSNQFWFDAMFRQWASFCVAAIQSPPAS